ncbi:MAG: helix-turn-helix domain-containing protein, partial [Paludibacteraceae bacterium]|nr:helix-turn-helix domain-containing protein [Paludibacteraceae bacterium]
LPMNEEELLMVRGVGKQKVRAYGEEIISLVQASVDQYGYQRSSLLDEIVTNTSASTKKTSKKKRMVGETFAITLNLFRQGKTVKEIAEERGLVESTIESHLLYCVEHDELDAEEVCPPERLKEVRSFVRNHPDMGVGDLRKECGEQYSWAEIRLALLVNKKDAELSDLPQGRAVV